MKKRAIQETRAAQKQVPTQPGQQHLSTQSAHFPWAMAEQPEEPVISGDAREGNHRHVGQKSDAGRPAMLRSPSGGVFHKEKA